MLVALTLSQDTRTTAGILLIALIFLLYAGIVDLTAGVLALGIGLLTA
jgi:hypothetical protein